MRARDIEPLRYADRQKLLDAGYVQLLDQHGQVMTLAKLMKFQFGNRQTTLVQHVTLRQRSAPTVTTLGKKELTTMLALLEG